MSSSSVDVAAVMAHKFEPLRFEYTERDVILYALGIGAAADPMDESELQFAYENHPSFSTLPTYGVCVPFRALGGVMNLPGLKFNPMMLLHGEQYMELRKPLPTSGTLINYPKIGGLYDKGKGALLQLDVETKTESGETIMFNRYSNFIRGIGGFGGDKGPKQKPINPPQRPPDVVQREATLPNQALLYRLAGDLNPLHADPSMAAMGGFKKPILHGLCSFGYAARAVLRHFCNNDVSQFKSIRVRFVRHVFPGETLITEMWRVAANRIVFRVKVAERGEYVLANAEIVLFGGDGSEEKKAAAAAPSSGGGGGGGADGFKAAAVFAELKKRINKDAVKQTNATFRFDVTNAKGAKRSWFVDLKNGDGALKESSDKADCMIAMKDDDLVLLMGGKMDPMKAFMGGKMKITGNMMLAQKLGNLVKTKAKL